MLPFVLIQGIPALAGLDESGQLIGLTIPDVDMAPFDADEVMGFVSIDPAAVYWGASMRVVQAALQQAAAPAREAPKRAGRFKPRGHLFQPLPEGMVSGYPLVRPSLERFRAEIPSEDVVRLSSLFAISTIRVRIEMAEASFECFVDFYDKARVRNAFPSVDDIRSCFGTLKNTKTKQFSAVSEYAPVIREAMQSGLRDRELRRYLSTETVLPVGLGLAKLSFTLLLLGQDCLCLDTRILVRMFGSVKKSEDIQGGWGKTAKGHISTLGLDRYEAVEDSFLDGNRFYDRSDPIGRGRAQWISWEPLGRPPAPATHSVWLDVVTRQMPRAAAPTTRTTYEDVVRTLQRRDFARPSAEALVTKYHSIMVDHPDETAKQIADRIGISADCDSGLHTHQCPHGDVRAAVVQYAYHTTEADRLPRIRVAGLVPGAMPRYDEPYSEFDDGHHFFFYDDMTQVTRWPNDVVLRFPRPADAKQNVNKYGRPLGGQFATKTAVPPSAIEIEHNGQWMPLVSDDVERWLNGELSIPEERNSAWDIEAELQDEEEALKDAEAGRRRPPTRRPPTRRPFEVGDSVRRHESEMVGIVTGVTPLKFKMSDNASRAIVQVRWPNGYTSSPAEGQLVLVAPATGGPVGGGPVGGGNVADAGRRKTLRIDKLIIAHSSLQQAFVDVQQGRLSRTTGPLSVWYAPEYGGKIVRGYLLVDGWHRLVERLLRGPAEPFTWMDVDVRQVGSGYSDYWQTPAPEDRVVFAQSRYGGLEALFPREQLEAVSQRLPSGEAPDATAPLRAEAHKPRIRSPLRVGTLVYHGTSSDDRFTMPMGPAWVSNAPEVAEWFANRWLDDDGRGGTSRPRVLTFRMKASPKLAMIDGDADWQNLMEWASDGDREQDINELAQALCQRGIDGWHIPNNYPEGSDTLLCEPEKFLEYVGVEPVTANAPTVEDRRSGARRGWQHRREHDEAVVRNLDPSLVPLWQRIGGQFRGSPEQRYSDFMQYVHEHPEEGIAATQEESDAKLERLIRQREAGAGRRRAPEQPEWAHDERMKWWNVATSNPGLYGPSPQPYVAYFYERRPRIDVSGTLGTSSETPWVFAVDSEIIAIFPELNGRVSVELYRREGDLRIVVKGRAP